MRKRRVYFDADGVMLDFNGYYTALFGGDPLTIDKRIKWTNIRKHGEFFLTLPKMEGIDKLWNMVPVEDRFVLSAVAKTIPNCKVHKNISIITHFDITLANIFLVNDKKDKPKYCQPGDILIDDREDNCGEWMDSGGIPIFFKNVEQACEDLANVLG